MQQKLSNGELGADYAMRDGIMLFQNRMMVPNNYQLKREIFWMYHEVPMAGHGGIQKTYKVVSELFYWPNMKHDIEEWVKHCRECQQVKCSTEKKQGALQPLPIPSRPWQHITMDFITGLPKSQGYSSILVIIDWFTK